MEAVKSVRNLRNVEPLKSFIAKEVLPGPDCKTDEELKTYIKKTLSTVWRKYYCIRVVYAVRLSYE